MPPLRLTIMQCRPHRGENGLDAIEKAIRSAFDKGNAEDRVFREKVYRSAFAALDRALQANPALTVEAAINRRKGLQAKITEIESEFMPAAPAVSVAPDVGAEPPFEVRVEPEGREADARSAGAPEVSLEPRSGPQPSAPTPDIEGARAAALPGSPAAEVAPDRDDARASERRRPFARMFLVATLLAAVGIGGWWVFQTGLLKTPAERDTTVPNPPATVESEDFTP